MKSFNDGFARCPAESEFPELWNGLVGLWMPALGVQGSLVDLSGFADPGALVNMEPGSDWIVGRAGWALNFDGTDEHLDFGNQPQFEWNGNFSIVLCLRCPSGDNTDREIVSIGGLTSNWKCTAFKWSGSSANILFQLNRNDGNAIAATTTSGIAINDGEIHHVVLIAKTTGGDNCSTEVFVDGVSRGSATSTGQTPGSGGTNPLRFGFATFVNRSNWIGELYEIRVYNRPLSASECIASCAVSPLQLRPDDSLTIEQIAAIELAAALTGTATVSASLTTAITLAAALTGTATVSASLTTAITLAAALTGTATVSASLTTAITLAAALSGTATVSASLTTAITLAAALSGTATVSASLTTAITLAAALTGTATVAADLTASSSGLAAALTATATVAASLTTAIALQAALLGTCTVLATLSGGVELIDVCFLLRAPSGIVLRGPSSVTLRGC